MKQQLPIGRPVPAGPARRRVAVGCQGVGSQTAFTAGALRRILRDTGLGRRIHHQSIPAAPPVGGVLSRPSTLMCGAVDVLSGQFAVFEECPDPRWRRRALHDHPSDVCVDTVLASAAVPPLMPAVKVGDGTYWDGMFAHNPPIRALLDRPFELRPDEIWVIEIDPESADHVPDSVLATVDRRFELSSNVSLQAELHWVRQINEWVDRGVLPAKGFKVVEIVRIALSRRLSDDADRATGRLDAGFATGTRTFMTHRGRKSR